MTIEFRPISASGLTMAVTSTASSISLSGIGNAVLLTNVGTNPAYVCFSSVSPVIATGRDMPVTAATPVVVLRDQVNDLFLGAVSDSGQSTTMKVTGGTRQ